MEIGANLPGQVVHHRQLLSREPTCYQNTMPSFKYFHHVPPMKTLENIQIMAKNPYNQTMNMRPHCCDGAFKCFDVIVRSVIIST